MLTDARWAMLEPLVEQCRPKSKTPPQDLRRTFEAILWRHDIGAKWRATPLTWAHDGAPLRLSSDGLVWVSGTVCSTWSRNAESRSA